MTEPEQNLGVCAICGGPPHFTDASPGANPVSYCSNCLPVHQQGAAAAGQMPLQGVTVPQLQEQARELDIDGRSSMKKDELAVAVSEAVAAEEVVDTAPVDPVEMTDAPTSDAALPAPPKHRGGKRK